MVERSLSMREVAGSMPASSTRFLPHALEDFPNREWLNLVGVCNTQRSTVGNDQLHTGSFYFAGESFSGSFLITAFFSSR